LASRITRKANHFEINPAGLANRTKLSGSVADFLTHAHTLARALFPAGANHPQVEFDVWIDDNPSAAETILLVDGLRVRHRNGPGRWQRVQWPGNDKEPGASLETRGFGVHAELTRAGNWGLFALLEAGTVDRGTDSDVFSVRWDLTDQGAGVVRIRIRPLEENNPFFVQGTPGFMQAFRAPALHPPALIVVDGPSC
jgi:type VI protein secretion system component VasK